jgi:hypothetical protein
MRFKVMISLLCIAVLLSIAATATADDSIAKAVGTIKDSVESAKDTLAADTSAHRYIAYYFHTTRRCPSCMKIEAYTKEAIDSGFVKALKNRSLEWQVVNTDEPENEHFLKDYQLFTKSVVLVDTRGGKQVKWTNLAKVWELLGDKAGFVKYVQDELSAFMKAD